MKIKLFEQINKEEDEGSFNWKTACLYYGILFLTIAIAVGIVWWIVLLVR